jgi:general secretion pathway protein M
MKDWFMGLDMRERKLVAGGVALLVLLMFYLLVWEPVAVGYHDLKQNVAAQQETLDWMKQASHKVKALQGSARGGARSLGGSSLLAVVDKSARSAGLGPAIKRVEPDGSKGVKIWLEGAAFDPMVLWLGKLSRSYGVNATVVTIEPQGEGRVNARLTLVGPAT